MVSLVWFGIEFFNYGVNILRKCLLTSYFSFLLNGNNSSSKSTTLICKCWVFAHNLISNQVAPIIVVFLWRVCIKYHQKVINFHQLKTFNGTNDGKLFAVEMLQAVVIWRQNIYFIFSWKTQKNKLCLNIPFCM